MALSLSDDEWLATNDAGHMLARDGSDSAASHSLDAQVFYLWKDSRSQVYCRCYPRRCCYRRCCHRHRHDRNLLNNIISTTDPIIQWTVAYCGMVQEVKGFLSKFEVINSKEKSHIRRSPLNRSTASTVPPTRTTQTGSNRRPVFCKESVRSPASRSASRLFSSRQPDLTSCTEDTRPRPSTRPTLNPHTPKTQRIRSALIIA